MTNAHFATIGQLVNDTKDKIDQLHTIVDIALSNYKAASEIIDPDSDRRQPHLNDLLKINASITSIVEQHPALRTDNVWHSVVDTMHTITKKETC